MKKLIFTLFCTVAVSVAVNAMDSSATPPKVHGEHSWVLEEAFFIDELKFDSKNKIKCYYNDIDGYDSDTGSYSYDTKTSTGSFKLNNREKCNFRMTKDNNGKYMLVVEDWKGKGKDGYFYYNDED